MKWIGLLGSGIIAVTIWSILFVVIFSEDGNVNQKAQSELGDSYEKIEYESEEELEEVEEFGVDNQSENNNTSNMDETMEDLSKNWNRELERTELEEHLVREGDAIAYGEGISIDDLLERINYDD